jgi:hypothetical protein
MLLHNLELYRYGLRAPEGAAAGGAGAAGGSPAGGGPAGGGGGPGAAGGAPGGAPAGGASGMPGASWYAPLGLEQSQVEYITSKNWDSPKALVKATADFERIARDRNVMLKPDPAKLNEWDGFAELGYDADYGRYSQKIAKPTVADGEILNEEFWGGILKKGHELKLPPSQLQGLAEWAVKWGNEAVNGQRTAIAGQMQEAEAALRKDWGGDYDNKRTLAQRVFRMAGIGVEDSRQLEAVMGAPGLVRTFARLGEMIGEEHLPQAGGGGTFGQGRSPSVVRSELKKFESDNLKVLNDRRDPLYEDTTARRQQLINELDRAQRANGGPG